MSRLLPIFAGFAPAFPAFAEPADGRWGYGPHMMGWGWFLGPLWMIVVLAGAIALAGLLLRWLSPPAAAPQAAPPVAPPTALEILKGRFARGEIDKKEFDDRRKALGD